MRTRDFHEIKSSLPRLYKLYQSLGCSAGAEHLWSTSSPGFHTQNWKRRVNLGGNDRCWHFLLGPLEITCVLLTFCIGLNKEKHMWEMPAIEWQAPSFAKYPVNVLWNNILVFSLHTICIQFLSQLKNWGRIYFYLWLVLYFRHGQKCLLGDAANAEKYAVEHKKAHKAVPWCCDRCPGFIGALESSWRRQCLGQVLWVRAWMGGVRGSISKLSGRGPLWVCGT